MSAAGWIRHWWLRLLAVLLVVCMLALAVWLVRGAIDDGEERRASRARIEGLAMAIEQQNTLILSVTGPEAQARSASTLGRAISEIRRSIDCSDFYFNDERPPACAEVTARLDAIRAGLDPFARPGGTP